MAYLAEYLTRPVFFLLLCTALFICCSSSPSRAFPVIDCVVHGSGDSDVALTRSYDDEKRTGSVKSGSFVYFQEYAYAPSAEDKGEIFKFEAGGFKSIGFVKFDQLVCDSGDTIREYPIVVRSLSELRKPFGLVFSSAVDDPPKPEKNRCPDRGELRLSISDTFLKPYRAAGLSLEIVCIVLRTGGAFRFDPETGERLPTYTAVHDLVGDEYPLTIPPCFARAVVRRYRESGSKVAKLGPIGCELRFNPWSGHQLDDQVSKAMTKLYSVQEGGGELGPSNEDAKTIEALAPSRILTLSRIDALRAQMKIK
jgi:hypothetical protein